ncbi:hypothetical protein SGFS_015520 [Streptomyces graminofaciens]|uniref:Uncharacterized protein n=1 Tax=Streptomyces graminofaciens TaxID=68212 RepID=A0ABN5VBJ2_9ACTN|nr:hypothetical protein SGFS_015520 [Streptomyces graminofaciens]
MARWVGLASSVGVNEAALAGEDHGLYAVARFELLKDSPRWDSTVASARYGVAAISALDGPRPTWTST